MKMKKYLLVTLLSCLTLFSCYAIPVPSEAFQDGITAALKSGSAKELSKFFNVNIDLSVLDKQDIYSKAQAELILKDFFTKNQPSNFTVLHQGGKEGSKYLIGNLTTSGGTFRVTINIKNQDNAQVIHQLRIESGNE